MAKTFNLPAYIKLKLELVDGKVDVTDCVISFNSVSTDFTGREIKVDEDVTLDDSSKTAILRLFKQLITPRLSDFQDVPDIEGV